MLVSVLAAGDTDRNKFNQSPGSHGAYCSMWGSGGGGRKD